MRSDILREAWRDPRFWMAVVLPLCGCAPSARAAEPPMSSYTPVLHHASAVSFDGDVMTNGRFAIVRGAGMVLEFRASTGGSVASHDTAATWTMSFELPNDITTTGAALITIDRIRSIGRIAGEDVLYLSRRATGKVRLSFERTAVTGQIDVAFGNPDRDLIGLDKYRIRGAFTVADEAPF